MNAVETIAGRVTAPWTEDQVASLNGYQQAGYVHPFTHGDGEQQVDLIATPGGWVAVEGGPVVQAWAHSFMADWSWKNDAFEKMKVNWSKAHPGKFNCHAAAEPDEPMFTLLARDPQAPALIRLWAAQRWQQGEDAEKVAEARACAAAMEAWRKEHRQ